LVLLNMMDINTDQLLTVDDSDTESTVSLATDDGEDHLPESIAAEVTRHGTTYTQTWYLVKWKDCPLIRSSWESISTIQRYPEVASQILQTWQEEKTLQASGKSKPLDIEAFLQAVDDFEAAERERHKLQRFKSKIQRVLSIVNS
ncbi:hypothetical protein BJ878DRAFT_418049, partial [Calycina marina]